MGKATARSLFGKGNRCLPLLVTVLGKDAPRFRTAAHVELSLVTGDAIQSAAVTWLTAVFPLCAAEVAKNAAWVVAAVSNSRPIDGPGDSVQVAVVNNQWTNALGVAVAHLATI